MQKTVLLTGVSGGIGSEIARRFIQSGDTVIGIYHSDTASVQQLSEELGRRFYSFSCDLSDFEQPEILFKKLEMANLSPDILINNAGISITGLLQDMEASQWSRLWNTNVTSVISMSKQVIPVFLQKGGGKIINISSVWGSRGASCEVGYSATKGAVDTFTKALAKELAPSDIQVNCISCGLIDTKMNCHLTPKDLDALIEEIPASRIGTPRDIADAVYALANAGSYLTGQIITVDGGWQV